MPRNLTGVSDDSKTTPRWRSWLKEFLVFAVILGAIFAYQTWNHVGSGDPAPAFDLPVLDADEPVSTASLRGKPTLVYFWAPWCGVCGATSENVTAVRRFVGDSANVVGVALSYRTLDELRAFHRDNDADYPVLLGTNDEMSAYSITSFPTFYVLDADGHVRSSAVGYTTTVGLLARLWWATLRS